MKNWLFCLSLLLFLLLLSSCDWLQKGFKGDEPFALDKTEEAAASLPEVTAQPLEKRVFRERVSGSGVLEPIRKVDLYALEGGKVSAIYKKPGDFVVEGQVIAEWSNPRLQYELNSRQWELQQLQTRASTLSADLEKAEANSRYTRKQYDRLTRNYGTSTASISPETLDKAELDWQEAKAAWEELKSFNQMSGSEILALESVVQALEERVAQLSLQAPFSGYLSALSIETGALVQAAFSDSLPPPLAVLADTKQVQLRARFPARIQSRIRKGTLVIVEVPGADTSAMETYLQQVDSAIDPQTQTIGATVVLENPSGRLIPGLKGSLTSVQSLEWSARALPLSAVHSQAIQPFIYVVVDGRLQQVPVQLGAAGMTHVELLSPDLPEGVLVVTAVPPGVTVGMEVRTVE